MTKVSYISPIGFRIQQAMDRLHWTETELVAEVRRLAPPEKYEVLHSKLSQQMINHLRVGGGERSVYTPFLAAALKVPCLWLAFGIPPETFDAPDGNGNDREQMLIQAFRQSDPVVRMTIERALGSEWTEEKPPRRVKPQKRQRRVA